MRHKSWMLGYLALLIIILLLSTLVAGLVQSPSLPELQSTNCQRTCWHGVEPGVTTFNETIQILSEHELPFEVNRFWFNNDSLSIDVTISHTIGVIFYTDEDVVGNMIIPVDYCVSTILDAFGIPDGVYSSDGYYEFVYSDEAVVFTTHEHGKYPDLTRVHGAMIGSVYIQNMPPFESWEDYAEVFAGECVD